MNQKPKGNSQHITVEVWGEIDKFWDLVGSYHKRLPRYVLQEIFKNKRWDDDPEFSLEPPRGDLHYWHKGLLELDGLGDSSRDGLYKGVGERAGLVGRVRWGARGIGPQIDSAALSHLYELRLADLGNIIDALATPEAAIALVYPQNSSCFDSPVKTASSATLLKP